MKIDICRVKTCDRPTKRDADLCVQHYKRKQYSGNTRPSIPLPKHFTAREKRLMATYEGWDV